jgi:DNA-directed RNA polymerase I subunit RPA2
LRELFAPHVASFDSLLAPGGLLDQAVASLPLVSIDANPAKRLPALRFGIESVAVGFPSKTDDSADTRVFPSECREQGSSYTAPLMVTYTRQVGDGAIEKLSKRMGQLPVMVRSSRCHLHTASPTELLARHEEATEQGGFFIVNGNDRLIRLLIVPRRHYVTAVVRPSFTNRGTDYTKFACQIRCVRPDQSSKTLTLHYLSSGSATLRFSLRKQEFFVPVLLLLKALVDCTDREIYDRLVQGHTDNAWLTDRVELMLRSGLHSGLRSREEVLRYLGRNFRIMTRVEPSVRDEEVGRLVLRDVLFVHCCTGSEETVNRQKFDLLLHMLHKLYELVQGRVKPDNPDAVHCQELLLPGHLLSMLLKERLEDSLYSIQLAWSGAASATSAACWTHRRTSGRPSTTSS